MTLETEYLLVTVSGSDNPGITAELLKIIVRDGHEIVDMGQAVTHGLLSLSILINTDESKESALLKELLFSAKSLGVSLDFQVTPKNSNYIISKDRYVLSCVCLSGLPSQFLADISFYLATQKLNIHRIDNVSEHLIFRSLDISITSQGNTDWQIVKTELINISHRHRVDIALIADNVFRRNKRLVVFDMDSTLINMEVIDEMAKIHGIADKVIKITERAMNGEIDFDQSLNERVGLLKGMSRQQLEQLVDHIQFNPGVEDFIQKIRSLGYKTALISGGFNFFAKIIKAKLKIDYAFANELDFENDQLTGKVLSPIVNAHHKAMLLDLLAQQEQISLEQVVAIGDGANDLPMLAKAGMGIAFHAKDIVKQNAQQHMSYGPMTSILYFLGIPIE